jgi:predicted DNA-binding transcriptional regulator YafY
MIRSVVTIEYKSRSGVSERNIQPIGLYASSGYWYCPAYCFLREEIRQFRADRLLSALLNGSIPSREDINQMTLMNKPKNDHMEQTKFRLELKIGDISINGNNFGVDSQTFVLEGSGDFRAYSTSQPSYWSCK